MSIINGVLCWSCGKWFADHEELPRHMGHRLQAMQVDTGGWGYMVGHHD